MVVFTCQHCNAALKKPAVEKHYKTKCRKNPYLTCVDCLNDFHGDAYISHTTCVSEDQRYGGANFVAKAVAVKQNSWFEVVQQCINNNTNPKYFTIFQRLINAQNVPRKKTKFINFMSCAMNMKNTALAGEIFEIFQKEFVKANSKKNDNESKDKPNTNGQAEVDVSEDNSQNSSIKRNHSTSESNAEKENPENSEINNSKKKKKKSKKQKTENGYNGALEEVNSISNDNENLEESLSNEVEKKKKKSKGNDKENLKEESRMIDETNINLEENAKYPDIPENTDNTAKLSKKELKKLKKKQKFEAELKQMEEEKLVESNVENKEDNPNATQTEKIESKKKKRKAHTSESEPENKKKKEKIEENAPVEAENDSNEQEMDIPIKSGKFHWDEVIKEILQNSSDQEMSLKRLTKKVISEYQAIKGEREDYGQLMSKFNKKINKIPGVRILKDKAKLLPEME